MGEARVLFRDFLISFCTSNIFVNYILSNKWKWKAKICTFITTVRIWPNRDINIRICSGTVDKWHSIVVTSLIWNMTSLGRGIGLILRCRLYKSLRTRALPTARQLDLYTVPTCAAWISVAIGGAHKAETVEQSIRQWSCIASLRILQASQRALMNQFMCDDRFSAICNTFIRISYR